jgi:hypothetical protein
VVAEDIIRNATGGLTQEDADTWYVRRMVQKQYIGYSLSSGTI